MTERRMLFFSFTPAILYKRNLQPAVEGLVNIFSFQNKIERVFDDRVGQKQVDKLCNSLGTKRLTAKKGTSQHSLNGRLKNLLCFASGKECTQTIGLEAW